VQIKHEVSVPYFFVVIFSKTRMFLLEILAIMFEDAVFLRIF
jgi:hypothetical protein